MNEELSRQIKAEALRLGFSACGVSPADAVDDIHRAAFLDWLGDGCQAGMDYMARNVEKRLDPRLLVEGAQSVISVALNYYPSRLIAKDEYQLAWYAYGEDYHTVMKEKLARLADYVTTLMPGCTGRAFCDTAPLLERYWAWRGGLGCGFGLLPGRTGHRPPPSRRLTPAEPRRHMHPLPDRLPDRSAPGTPPAGCPPLPVLSHHRTPWRHPSAGRQTSGQQHLRMRPLSTGMSVEPLYHACHRNTAGSARRPARHAPGRLGRAQSGTLPHAVQRFGRETCQIRGTDEKHSCRSPI